MTEKLKSCYPYFGGKAEAADRIWQAFGNVDNYVEPFFGSGAVLLGRPGFSPDTRWTETVNDLDGFIANFWRALQADPEAVAYHADYPINETDLHARHSWLVNRADRLTWSLEDPDFYDPKVAGWWVWGICQWIGAGFCSGKGPWVGNGAHIVDSRQLPHLGDAGQGINRKRPHLMNDGKGIFTMGVEDAGIYQYLGKLAERMRNVRVCCGDWTRVLGDSVTVKHGTTAVFLDPPYADTAGRQKDLYRQDSQSVAHDVREWCIANGDNKLLRIILAGYEGEHEMPDTWICVDGKAGGGMGYGGQGEGRGRENAKRERLWLSPHCVSGNAPLFAMFENNA